MAFESQVEAAVADAIAHDEAPAPQAQPYGDDDDGVTVEPYIPAGSYDALDETQAAPEEPVPSVYVPSNAARPDGQRRMPRTEELPAVARRSLGAEEKQEAEPRNARALFKRLASNVGINLRPDEVAERAEPLPPSLDDAAARSAIEAGAPRVSASSAAAEGARGQLDAQGRQAPQPAAKEHLEIPAFLRKHG